MKSKSVMTITDDCKEILDFSFNYYLNELVCYLENAVSPILYEMIKIYLF